VIKDNVRRFLGELPENVTLLAAAKSREPHEIIEAIEGGITVIGENYVQEAERAHAAVGGKASWHFIGHLQKNKVKKAVELFDVIETVDSLETAREIDGRCAASGKTMFVFIEVNSGREAQKSGVLPEHAEELIREISRLPNVRVTGLMTMGPLAGDPEDSRAPFRETRELFEHIKGRCIPNVDMKHLSMGMSHTYRVALEEGATIVRIGTAIFGERTYDR
jgi:pyridoxal phosphate enzyme (YggS family)